MKVIKIFKMIMVQCASCGKVKKRKVYVNGDISWRCPNCGRGGGCYIKEKI